MTQIKQMLIRLKKPSVTLSIISQVISLCILMGYNINENKIMALATIACSILVTLGIMSNPDTKKKGYGDDLITCSNCGDTNVHVSVGGEMVCSGCGAVLNAVEQASQAAADALEKVAENSEPPGQ